MASKAPTRYNLDDIPHVVAGVKKAFQTRTTMSLVWRKQQLKQIKACLKENWDSFYDALKSDLQQIELVAKFEHNQCITECDYMLEHLDEWVKPEPREVPAVHLPAWGSTVREPHGVVLIISPWNYPAQLTLLPAIGAIAAGNCVVIKPSELAPAISKWLATTLPKYVDNERIVVIEGAVDETTALLKEKWDLIFYTGNPFVGKIVAEAAAKFLTPVVLELGGKSPVIIDSSVNLSTAAKRVAFGKFTNCGQTCIAPDHVFVHKDVEKEFVQKMKETLLEWYGQDPKLSKDYSRIVAPRHVARIKKMIDSVPKEKIIIGGNADENDKYVAPTLISNPGMDSLVMKEEIFGPVLPIITYTDLNEVIGIINAGEKPLALYLFSTNKESIKLLTNHTSSGALVINETITHGTCREIPFGGVGNSGYGNYYGKYSFNTFSHEKGIFQRTMLPDPNLKYPPYNSTKVAWVARLLNLKLPSASTVLTFVAGLGTIALTSYAYYNGYLAQYFEYAKGLP